VPRVEGDTAVVVIATAVEPVVGGWRSRYDSSASVGVPAHVTVLYPFLPRDEVVPDVVDRLASIVAAEAAFDVTFARFGRFPGSVLWLDPEPAEPFRRLTHAVWRAWPQTPPYGGVHDGVTPHLTVAEHSDEGLLDEISVEVARALPVSTAVTGAQLLVVRNGVWTAEATLPLHPPG
jgi:2'-5' RNA ligase